VPKPPQRKILSLDGGGIRGVISVEVLHRLETLLREQTGRPDLRLCDWFDLIAGTSTGAITAALLGLGHSVADIRRFSSRAHACGIACVTPTTPDR
jgi:patatin-like phospholipase/acyl hydrolase